nr:hypothetical protein [Verrucomicrobiota bacterium]
YGLGIATLGLFLALVFRSRGGQVTSLALIFLCALSAWPVIHYRHAAYDSVLTLSDDDGRAWLEEHEARAEKVEWFFYALAAGAATAIILPRKWSKAGLPLAVAVLLLALVSLGAGGWIAYAGGKIRHREFRTTPPPVKKDDRENR